MMVRAPVELHAQGEKSKVARPVDGSKRVVNEEERNNKNNNDKSEGRSNEKGTLLWPERILNDKPYI